MVGQGELAMLIPVSPPLWSSSLEEILPAGVSSNQLLNGIWLQEASSVSPLVLRLIATVQWRACCEQSQRVVYNLELWQSYLAALAFFFPRHSQFVAASIANLLRSCFVYAYMSATWFYAPLASAEVGGLVSVWLPATYF